MLAGNVVAIGMSGIICVVVSLIKPQNYNWELMKEIPLLEDDPNAHLCDGDASPEALTRALKYTYMTAGARWGWAGHDGTTGKAREGRTSALVVLTSLCKRHIVGAIVLWGKAQCMACAQGVCTPTMPG